MKEEIEKDKKKQEQKGKNRVRGENRNEEKKGKKQDLLQRTELRLQLHLQVLKGYGGYTGGTAQHLSVAQQSKAGGKAPNVSGAVKKFLRLRRAGLGDAKKTTARSIPVWSPTTVLTAPSPA